LLDHSRRAWYAVAVAAVAISTGVGGAAAQGRAAAGRTRPRITAKPANLMVDQSTMLAGSGFPRGTELTLRECASTAWIVPQEPCLEGATVTVKTNAAGRFKTSLKVGVCAGEVTGPTERRCYVGEPKPSGIDTVELLGAATILVSYP